MRLILNRCFGAAIDLLPDNTYWGRTVPFELVYTSGVPVE
jgi:hypothetical protein